MRERTIVMSGYSKTFAVTGWRIGYLMADPKWTPAIGYFHDLTYVCAPAPLQHGVADGVEQLPPEYYLGLAADHDTKRQMLLAALRDAGMTPHTPNGAYYILADADSISGPHRRREGAQVCWRRQAWPQWPVRHSMSRLGHGRESAALLLLQEG